jgi:hypothetical protein
MIKHYNVITAVTREIPFKMWSPLAKRLTIIPDIKAHDECSSIELLIKDTNALLLEKIPYYNELISFLHSKQKFEQLPHKSIQCDSGWENQFVYDAFQLLCSNESHDKLYDLVIMLSEAKYKKLIEHETDLGYYALSYEPEMLERMAMGSLTITYDDFFKRKIALLCSCIEKYNNARKDKITPPVELYCIYKTLKPLHIIVPDTFDKDFLNPYKIAFAEYAELLDDIDELYQAYPDAVEDCIKELYPSQLCTIINT